MTHKSPCLSPARTTGRTARLYFLGLLVAALGLFVSAPSLAADPLVPGAENLPKPADETEITADQMEYDSKGNRVVCEGNVDVVNGDIRIKADRAFALLSPEAADSKFKQVEVTGNVTITHLDSKAVCKRAIYTVAGGTIELLGEPRMDHGPHSLTGADSVVYDIKNGVFSTKGGRVRLQLRRDADANELIRDLPLADGGNAAPIAGPGGRQIILADQLTFETQARRVTFAGDVQVDDADVTMNSGELTVRYGEDNQVTNIEAAKKVRAVRGDQTATAEKATYDVAKGYMEMTGDPILEQPGMKFMDGDKIVYQRETGKMTATGRPKIIWTRQNN